MKGYWFSEGHMSCRKEHFLLMWCLGRGVFPFGIRLKSFNFTACHKVFALFKFLLSLQNCFKIHSLHFSHFRYLPYIFFFSSPKISYTLKILFAFLLIFNNVSTTIKCSTTTSYSTVYWRIFTLATKPQQYLDLSSSIDKMNVLGEILVDFENLRGNIYDLYDVLRTKQWKTYFDRLNRPIYPEIVKDFWVHAYVSDNRMICSKVSGQSICIIKEDISLLIGHDGPGERCINMPTGYSKMCEISSNIIKSNVKNRNHKELHGHLRGWLKIILKSFYYRPSNYSLDYINIDQKYLLNFIASRTKVNFPEILFNFLKNFILESKRIKWIPLGRLNSME